MKGEAAQRQEIGLRFGKLLLTEEGRVHIHIFQNECGTSYTVLHQQYGEQHTGHESVPAG